MNPDQTGNALRNFRVIYRVILYGTYLVIAVISLLLFISFTANQNGDSIKSLAVCAVAGLYVGITHALARSGRYKTPAYMLAFFYIALATGIVWNWGINTPIGVLLFGLAVVLAGIILTAWHSLLAALLAGLILLALQIGLQAGWHSPDAAWSNNVSSFGDVFAYWTIYFMLALISWLYNREMERSLAHANRVGLELLQQKATLEERVEQRTSQLKQAQLEEISQMYRFAELGQLGVSLLHDLANHIAALTLEIEDLEGRSKPSDNGRLKQIIGYLERMVDSTRDRLHGGTQRSKFNLARKISETLAFVGYKAAREKVAISWTPPAKVSHFVGDAALLCQIIAVLVNNAIDAYGPVRASQKPRQVAIKLEQNQSSVHISITDWGRGISAEERKNIFKLFHSTKKEGMGIGLFIAKRTIETDFDGSLSLSPATDRTEFIIKLPRRHGE